MLVSWKSPKRLLYQPPTDAIKERYRELFNNRKPLPVPVAKLIFDKLAAGMILLFCLPILAGLYLFNWIQGLLIEINMRALLQGLIAYSRQRAVYPNSQEGCNIMPYMKGSEIPKDGHAMIIGAMKCGTSSLFDYLRGHPELSPSISKEPEFFSENQGHSVPVDKYSDLFDFDSSRHKYTLEASTGYTKFPVEQNVPKRIFEYGIRPKFIYIVRNPFDRIQSHFNYMIKDSKWKLPVLDDHLVSTSDYYLQLEQYNKCFPREDILLLDFADLKDRPAKALISVYEFLGLSTDFVPKRFEVKNVTKAVPGVENELKRLFAPLLPWVPGKIKRLTTQVLRNAVPARKRELTPEEKRVIHDRLCENMRRLKAVYGIDTSKWGFNNG